MKSRYRTPCFAAVRDRTHPDGSAKTLFGDRRRTGDHSTTFPHQASLRTATYERERWRLSIIDHHLDGETQTGQMGDMVVVTSTGLQ